MTPHMADATLASLGRDQFSVSEMFDAPSPKTRFAGFGCPDREGRREYAHADWAHGGIQYMSRRHTGSRP